MAAGSPSINDLNDHIRVLKAQLAAANIEPFDAPPAWAKGLSAGPTGVMVALLKAYPRLLDRTLLEEVTPKKDHARDRDLKIVSVYVSHIRKALGQDAIETIWGHGFRRGAAFYEKWGQR